MNDCNEYFYIFSQFVIELTFETMKIYYNLKQLMTK